ncbi:MAG: nucleotidyl transferase AbiEii/AbiGii toxin family protein [Planctomycetota bacterium]
MDLIDIHEKRIKTVDPSGCVATVLEVPFIPNAFGLTPEGTIVVGDAFHRKIYRKAAGKLEQIADIGSLTTFCLSDGIVDARGRLYVGDIGYNFIDPKAEPVETCVIVLVGQDGGASVVSDKLFFPNGMVITPDGICLDADGAVWCANPEGTDSVVRVREGGEITDRIQVATHAYAVMLGGAAAPGSQSFTGRIRQAHRTLRTIGPMTGRQFYDWQTAGGADDVMRMVDALERAELHWCAIGGIAVNHWAAEPMVTRDVDFVVAVEEIARAVAALEAVGFMVERHEWSVNFRGRSQVSLQLNTEDFYRDFPARAVAADVHGILLRVASLPDTLAGKIKAWRTPERRTSKAIKDLGDIARLVEAHPQLAAMLPADVIAALDRA